MTVEQLTIITKQAVVSPNKTAAVESKVPSVHNPELAINSLSP